MKIVVGVSELSVGMYVVRVIKSSGSATMKSKGLIKNKSVIAKLKALKVQQVEVDTEKSEGLDGEEDESFQPSLEQNSEATVETSKSISLNQELNRAREVYEQARETQSVAFEKIRSSGQLDVEPFEQLAAEFFDSICRNQDALLCMTKLQDKDSYLLEHSLNVAILLAIFAKHLGLEKNVSLKLTLAGFLHDIGKVKVPDAILFKQGRLTKQEFLEIKKHPAYGEEILKQSGMDGLVIQVALQHHERLSGSGYPSGLIAHQLNTYVRMSCIVDVFDAITAERVYKPGMTALEALKIIRKSGSSEFDEKLLNQFVRAIGLFSVCSIVMMKSEKLAIVTQSNYSDSLKPIVTIFYHTVHKRHLEPVTLDLSAKKAGDSIDKMVNAADFGIDINAIIDRFVISV